MAPDPGTSEPKAIVGRSPGQLAWMRLRRDRTAFASAITLLVALIVGLSAPLIERMTGISPTDQFTDKLTDFGALPVGYLGGISGTHLLGLEPGLGRDILMQLVYGLRTSLLIAFASAAIATTIGVLMGVVAGYARGWLDGVMSWIIDLTLAFPFLIFALAAIPVVENRFFGARDEIPAGFRVGIIIATFAIFNWTNTARLVRGQVISLREREFVEAARASGASTAHILLRQLLPNIWAPILVTVSLNVPAFITAEAALAFVGIGVTEPTPDLGRMIFNSIQYISADPMYTFIPGVTIFLLVLAFNLFGDSLRDALDPKSSR
ncbi:ABC transporter permease [Actinoplanes sp. URMC 104]|uniref:ABC transporter permease n=1 Tax=Actinoplanes sp. URMC 104 TaxID=3423409 RepID=UPI003F1CBE84